MSYNGLLVFKANIIREIEDGFDDYGNIIKEWVEVAENVACRLVESSSDENLNDRDTIIKDGLLYLLPDVDITFLDRVEINNETWEVFGAPKYITGLAFIHHVEAPVRLINL